MKKIILPILLTCALFTNLLSQDMLGGEISVQYLNGGVYDVQVSLYTRASIVKDRSFLNIHRADPYYQIIPRVFDTIVAPNVRFNYYQGFYSLISSNSFSSVYIYDSIPNALFNNVNFAGDSLTRVEILSIYDEMDFYNHMPLCVDNFVHADINNGRLEHQFDCTDPDGDSLVYSIQNYLYNHVDSHEYTLPTGVNISPNGLFTWDMPATPGWYLFNVQITDLHYTPADMNRLFFVNLDSTMATPTEWIDNHNYLQVYPNPTTNYLTIKFDYFTPKDTEIEIFDMVGRRVHRQLMEQQNEQVDLSHFANGVYVVRVRSGEETWTKKIVKQ